MRSFITLSAVAAALATLVGTGRPAAACGGFFCSREAPVDQAGEQILFDLSAPGTVRMHVRVQYEGPSEEFAWVLPIPREHGDEPLSVGTELIFDTLERTTQPVLRLNQRTEGECLQDPRWSCSPWGGEEGEGEGGEWGEGEGEGEPGGVEVLVEDTVGPFDVVILNADNADVLVAWLQGNGYDVPDDLAAPLASYIDSSHLVAMKLTKGADAGDLQPVVLEYAGDMGSIPIELTAVAAAPDMPITVWVVGDGVAAPISWPVVEPNTARLPWDSCGFFGSCNTQWRELVGEAADEAGGRAFAIDRVMRPRNALRGLDWIVDRGFPVLLRRLDSLCQLQWEAPGFFEDSRVRALLEEHVLGPADVPVGRFVGCPCCFARGQLDAGAWRNFADAFTELVLPELRDLYEGLRAADSLTRLYTRISPGEMTLDPTFALVEGLEAPDDEVTATLVRECEGDVLASDAHSRLELADGTVVGAYGPDGFDYDADRRQAAAKRVVRYSIDGEAEVLTDNTDELNEAHAATVAAQREALGPVPTQDPEELSCDNYCCQADDPCDWAWNRRCDCGAEFVWDHKDNECEAVCVPGRSEACVCATGSNGAQVCSDDGMRYEPCVCAGDPPPVDDPGDGEGGEDPEPDPEPVEDPDPDRDPDAEPDIGPGEQPDRGRPGADISDEPAADISDEPAIDRGGGLCATSPGRGVELLRAAGVLLRR